MTSTIRQLSEPFGRLGLRFAGRPDGEPLVLLHGVGMQSEAWAPQIDALSDLHAVYALDLPGHGQSGPIAAGAQLPAFVEWLRAALDALNLDHVNLVGHSMGALIAGGFAVEHPDRVRRVALLNGVFRRDDQARDSVLARAGLISAGTFDLETPLQRWFANSPADRTARDRVAAWLAAVDVNGYAAAYDAFARGDMVYADRYPQISCPLLALTGAEDPNSTPDMTRAIAAAAKGQAVVVEGHRHMVNLTDPKTVNAALVQWLKTPTHERSPA
ncbi:alpha/beta fold hydrolase [Ruegeria arenilitoris]|uniref:alpha/beta fold hydrolase n=1 Tax=Ruegeria arenilitoris TaxID=1173585 RepID=UPI00147F12C8|nr:alpha/beta fold hydrolase [Ruegeria arenilitoris]